MRFRLSEWQYINLTLAAFVFAPEIRRLTDWRGGSSVFNIFSALPTLMLIPIVFFVVRSRRSMSKSAYFTPATIWTIAFTYGLVIAIAYKFILPGLYGFGIFVLPVFLGAWLATSKDSLQQNYSRMSSAIFVYGAIAGLYGVIQFVTAPPWDTAWMQAIKAESFGQPEKFAIRVFSLMNSPGTYAEFTACALILNLPNIRLNRPWSIAAALVMTVGLLLSLVRSAWLAVFIGTVLFAMISPLRKQAVVSIAAVSGVFVAVALAFFAFVPSADLQQTLLNRVNSLANISDDPSALDRAETSRVAFEAAVSNPLGQGLGLTGTTSNLASKDDFVTTDIPSGAIDNGFITRFLELGVIGFGGFLLAIFAALIASWRNLRSLVRSGNKEAATIIAALLATQASIFLISFSGDVYSGIGSVLFFIAFGLGVKSAVSPAVIGLRNLLPERGARMRDPRGRWKFSR